MKKKKKEKIYQGIERISDIAKEMGKIGGKKTLKKYGRKHFVEMGKKSGKVRRNNK